MNTSRETADANLENLRAELTNGITLVVMCTSAVVAWHNLTQEPIPVAQSGALLLLLVAGWGIRKLNERQPGAARYLLLIVLNASLFLAMWFLTDLWLPYVGLILVSIGMLLTTAGGFATAGALTALVVFLSEGGYRAYSLPGFLLVLAIDVTVAALAANTLYTALGWAWTMQERADKLLEVARDRQAELLRALNSLDKTNWILQRTRRELITARKKAEEARSMKEQFAANVSHELRTPLSLLLGFSEMMYLAPEVYGNVAWTPTLRKDVYKIYRNSRHLLDMVNDILDLSRFEIVGFTLSKERMALPPLIRGVIETAADLFRGRCIELTVEVAEDLPPLEIDRTRIRQVLLNLLNNAACFTEAGSVRVKAQRIDGEVVISVQDTGVGIPQDNLQHIFDEFYQVDLSLHRKHAGAGLGLAICRQFVEAHDGRVWAESEEGVGSTFYFALPVPGEQLPVAHLALGDSPELSELRTRPTVLVVDADPAVVSLIDRRLEKYDVVQVVGLDQLSDAVAAYHPHMVIQNVPPAGRQPEARPRDGSTLPFPVPVVECSLPSQAWLADGLTTVACLTKPFAADQLLREVARLQDVRDVLVVDDDRGFCELVARMLCSSGHQFRVREAYDGAEGLRVLRAHRPDLLLLDLLIPGVDGFQFLETMRHDAELAEIPVVVLTATSCPEDLVTSGEGHITVRCSDGMGTGEVLRCLCALAAVLEPRYGGHLLPHREPDAAAIE